MADFASIMLALHVTSAALWVGGAVFQVSVVGPALMRSGPQAGPFLREVMGRGGFSRYFAIVSTLALLTGGYLIGKVDLFGTLEGYHIATLIGLILALLAWVSGAAIMMPTENKMRRLILSLKGPPSGKQAAEMQGYGMKLGKFGAINAGLVFLALVFMLGRYWWP